MLTILERLEAGVLAAEARAIEDTMAREECSLYDDKVLALVEAFDLRAVARLLLKASEAPLARGPRTDVDVLRGAVEAALRWAECDPQGPHRLAEVQAVLEAALRLTAAPACDGPERIGCACAPGECAGAAAVVVIGPEAFGRLPA
jgi:hypothetical protein